MTDWFRADAPRVVAALLLVPAVVAVLCLGTMEAWRVYKPRSLYFNTPLPTTFAEAIENGDVMVAYEFIRAGADANATIQVRHPVLTGGRAIAVSPVEWAVATNNDGVAYMLLAFGGTVSPHDREPVACLAEAVGNQRLADFIRGETDMPQDACEEIPARDQPLLLRFPRLR